MLDEYTARVVGAIVFLILGIMLYTSIDLILYGPVWKIWTFFISPVLEKFVDWAWPADYNYYNKSNSPQKEKGVKPMNYYGNYLTPRYDDVWVLSFIDPKDPAKGYGAAKLPMFYGDTKTHEWRWLQAQGQYGWREKEPPKPPPVPMFSASEGIMNEVDSILEAYRASKNIKESDKPLEIDTKSLD